MIRQIRADLQNILTVAPMLLNAKGAGRVFELFIMSQVARELKTRGYSVWLQRSDGTKISSTDLDRRFFQRGGAPSGVAGAAQGNDKASVIGFETRNRSIWEIWNGVQFMGRSSAKHEVDLAIVPKQIGEALRARPAGGIPLGRPTVAIECKDVAGKGNPDEMRAFIARLYDLTLLQGHQQYLGMPTPHQSIYPNNPASNHVAPKATFWVENRETLNILARRADFSLGALGMTVYHCIKPYSWISARSPNANILKNDIVNWIDGNLN